MVGANIERFCSSNFSPAAEFTNIVSCMARISRRFRCPECHHKRTPKTGLYKIVRGWSWLVPRTNYIHTEDGTAATKLRPKIPSVRGIMKYDRQAQLDRHIRPSPKRGIRRSFNISNEGVLTRVGVGRTSAYFHPPAHAWRAPHRYSSAERASELWA